MTTKIVTTETTNLAGNRVTYSSFHNGTPHGTDKIWWPNNTLQWSQEWNNGKKEGEEKYWNKAGKLIHQIMWKNGKKDGLEEEWDDNGNIKHIISWKEGRNVEEKWFYPTGSLRYTIYYVDETQDPTYLE